MQRKRLFSAFFSLFSAITLLVQYVPANAAFQFGQSINSGLIGHWAFEADDLRGAPATSVADRSNAKNTATGYNYISSTPGTPQVYSTATTGTSWQVPANVSAITVKAWGGGGGGGAYGKSGTSGAGGGGGYAQSTIAVTAGETLTVMVGGGGGNGVDGGNEGTGGGGGGYSAIKRSTTMLLQAAGGGGGGGTARTTSGAAGAGRAGGGTSGVAGGGGVGGSGGGGPGTSSTGGAGGTGGSGTDGTAGSANQGGIGGRGSGGGTAGTNGGGSGGTLSSGDAGGGGGGGGYYGGGGGESGGGASNGGAGGGGGSSYTTGTSIYNIAGSGTAAGNNADSDYAGSAGAGGAGSTSGNGTSGNPGRVVINYNVVTGAFDNPAGVLGDAVGFNGTDQYLSMGNVGTAKTIAFWIKADDNTSRQVINLNGTDYIELAGTGSNTVTATGTGLSGATVYVDGAASPLTVDTGWHHIVITTSTGVSVTTLQAGKGPSGYFDGAIDELRVYDRVLTADEINRLIDPSGAASKARQGVGTNDRFTNGLEGLWSFDGPDISGTTAIDRSGNGNNGTQQTTLPPSINEWTERLGGSSTDYGRGIATDSSGNVYVAGYVTGNADLNGDGTIAATRQESVASPYGNADIFVSAFSSSGTSLWTERLGGSGADIGYAITTDSSGNVYVTGYVTGSADLNGDGTIDATEEETVASPYGGTYDIFVSAFSSSGTSLWTERLGGSATDNGSAITTDRSGNVYVMGYVAGSADLNGDGIIDATRQESAASPYVGIDIYVSAFNSSGTSLWTERLGGSGGDYGQTIITDRSGNVYVAGRVAGSADLNGDGTIDATEEETATSPYGGAYDIFVSAFDSTGTSLWTERLGGSSTDNGYGITTDRSGNVYVTGVVTGSADLNGDGTIAATRQESVASPYGGTDDIFVSAFSSSGTSLWTERLGGSSADSGYGITTDSSGNVYVTGSVNGSADLNGDGTIDATEEETATSPYGNTDIFVSAFDSSGTSLWTERLGGGVNDFASVITTDSSGNVYVAGYVNGNADLNGDGTIDATRQESVASPYGSDDIFVSVFSINTSSVSATAGRIGQGLSFENAYVDIGNTSTTANSVSFWAKPDDIEDQNILSLSGTASVDMELVFPDAWQERLGGSGADIGFAITTDSSGNVYVTGAVEGSADLNGDGTIAATEEETAASPYGVYDIFVSAFDSTGTSLWTERLGGGFNDFANAITTDSSGNVYVTGYVNGNADLNGDGTIDATEEETAASPYGGYDIFISAFNSTGTPLWTERLGGSLFDSGYAIATDRSGNVYVTGVVQGSADLNGDGTIDATEEETAASPYGGYDIFVSAFNSSGTSLWTERLGGSSSDSGYGIITDRSGNVYVTGRVAGSADLNGDGTIAATRQESVASPYGSDDIFVSAFDSTGTSLWTERLGGSSTDYGYGITTDSSGNVYVTGLVNGSADLNGDGTIAATEEETAASPYGGYDIFVSAFNSSGTSLWTERLGGSSTDYGYGITTDRSGNVYVMGYVNGNADLNGDGTIAATEEETAASPYGSDDIFVSAFSSSGTSLWTERLGGGFNDFANAITTDSSGNVYVAGLVYGSADLNGDGTIAATEEETAASPYGSDDIFVSAFSSSGTSLWTERLGGSSTDYGRGITTDSSGNVYVMGYVNGNADLNGDGTIAATRQESVASPYGIDDIFVSAFSSSGTSLWTERLGGSGTDKGYGITTDRSGNVYVMGYVAGSADLNGDGTIAATRQESVASPYGNTDIFVSVFTKTGNIVSNGFTSPTTYIDGAASTSLFDTDWHHIVITDSTGATASDVQIGTDGSDYFAGILDDVRIYTSVLSGEEIDALASMGGK